MLGKLRGQAVKVAGVIHNLLQATDLRGTFSKAITKEVMKAGCAICDYFANTKLAIYQCPEEEELEDYSSQLDPLKIVVAPPFERKKGDQDDHTGKICCNL